jgi:hypothetical protein
VLAHVGSVLGLGIEAPTLEQVADAIAAASVVAFVVDSYERFGLVGGWLRTRLLPSLPGRTTTVLVGRNPPNVAWRTAPGWRQLLVDVRLGPLTEAGAAQLVARNGLAGDRAERARRFGRGHPLALELACEALVRHPDLVVGDAPPAEVVEELVEVLFDDLDPDVPDVVEAASVLRRVTVPALAAVLERNDEEVERAWVALRDLPFATVRPDGVELKAVVQDVTATRLELRDPGRARDLRRRAARAALATVRHAPGWAATADLLHLVQNPVVRSAFLPPAGSQHPPKAFRCRGDRAAACKRSAWSSRPPRWRRSFGATIPRPRRWRPTCRPGRSVAVAERCSTAGCSRRSAVRSRARSWP